MPLSDPTNQADSRAVARAAFLEAAGHGRAALIALPADASFRRYYRLAGANPPQLLMDAPPPKEDVRPFVRIGRHLTGLGLSAPAIHQVDEVQGFALIEDFGDDTYTRLLDSGAAEEPLFTAATDALVLLHAHPKAAAVEAPSFDVPKFLEEVSELPDWYGLAVTGRPLPVEARDGFVEAWQELLDAMPPSENGLVLLDYHVDNLMRVAGRTGAAACGILDFQDARIGPKAYDLLCLLRNERRGIDAALSDRLYEHYIRACPPADPESFSAWYRVLTAQRYTKVVGRFARLTLRDSRDGYLKYLPRVLRLLADALRDPLLGSVRQRLHAILPDWQLSPSDNPAALRQRVASARG
jgi:aminoglycoside/choline kinase family phosphotransferase